MRPTERIDIILNIIKSEWKKNPDLRFIQLLSNLGIDDTNGPLYFIEDTELMKKIFPNINPAKYTMWGTRGKSGNSPITYKCLSELSDSHLESILKTQIQITDELRNIIQLELDERKKLPIDKISTIIHANNDLK